MSEIEITFNELDGRLKKAVKNLLDAFEGDNGKMFCDHQPCGRHNGRAVAEILFEAALREDIRTRDGKAVDLRQGIPSWTLEKLKVAEERYEDLAMGGEDGPDEELNEQFPNVDAALNSFF